MVVLVTDIKYRMALAAVRDLADAGHTVYGLHFGQGVPPAMLCRGLRGCRCVSECTGTQRAQAVLDYAQELQAQVFPIGAATIAALAEADAGLLVPTPEQLRLANGKDALLAFAAQEGLPVPEAFETPEAAEHALPVVLKYRNGEALGLPAPQRYVIARTPEELHRAWTRMCARAAAGGQAAPLIQRYVSGSGWGVSCVFDRESRPVSVICHRRVREYPVTGGPSACCEAVWNEEMVHAALRLLRAMRWQGVAMVEFKGEPGDFALMEINPRIWGSFPLTRVSGSGFADAYVRAAAGAHLPACGTPQYRVGARMGFSLSNLAAGAAWLRRGKPGACFAALRDALGFGVRDGAFEWRDLRASLRYLWSATFGRHSR